MMRNTPLPAAPELPLAQIIVPAERARSHDPAWSEALAHIIAEQGLIHPVSVRQTPEGWVLVSGLHRLRAFEALGRGTIPVHLSQALSDDAARLEEVMENLGRAELIALDRCQHLYELKQVWERLHPDAGHGGDRKSIKRKSLPLDPDQPQVFGFSEAVAENVGLSGRAIRLAVKIWTDLAPASRQRLVGSDLARKQTELKALSELPTPVQAQILDLILGEAEPETVAQALEMLANGVVMNAFERRFFTLTRSLAALDDDSFDRLLAAQEERVIASLKRMERI